MKSIQDYLIAAVVIGFAIMPPIGFNIKVPPTGPWTYMVTAAGFLGIVFLFLETAPIIRVLPLFGFISCFFSSSPFISFSAYVNLVASCYFYYACLHIKNWDVIFKAILALVIFEGVLMLMQLNGKDGLLNFGFKIKDVECWGTVGNRMQLESLFVLSFALLLQRLSKISYCCVLAVSFLYGLIAWKGLIHNPITERLLCWRQTWALVHQHPWAGWGLGTFKILGPVLIKAGDTFKMVHNDYLQILFENGWLGLFWMLVYMWTTVYCILWRKDWRLLIGFSMIAVSMTIHFPIREFQTFLLLVLFLAFCEVKLVGSQVK